MKKVLVVIVALVFALSLSNSSVAQDKKAADKKVAVTKTVVDKKPVNKVCAVSNEELDKSAVTVTYKDKTYALCCKKCIEKFNKNPEKYIKNIGPDGKWNKSAE